jgi:hypothetical protein
MQFRKVTLSPAHGLEDCTPEIGDAKTHDEPQNDSVDCCCSIFVVQIARKHGDSRERDDKTISPRTMVCWPEIT